MKSKYSEQARQQAITEFKTGLKAFVVHAAEVAGGVPPMCYLLTEQVAEGEIVVANIPVTGPDEPFGPYEKDRFFEHILPGVFASMHEEGLNPLCFTFITESYLRVKPANSVDEMRIPTRQELDEMPSQDTVIILWETRSEGGVIAHEVVETPKVLDENGELRGGYKLEPLMDEITTTPVAPGLKQELRMMNVFRHFKPVVED